MDNLINILLENRIVIMPCDTIYGIVGIYPQTENKIREIKGRDERKPFLVLIQKNWIKRFTNLKINKYFLDKWPGSLTLIVPGIDGSTIALRVPDDSRLQKILHKIDQPLYSTSVNRSGMASLELANEIEIEFGLEVDLFINEGDLKGNRPSTIIDLSQEPYKIIRQGACPVDLSMIM